MRALFAIKTILFLGFSFTDAYINDLRSEVLSLLGLDGSRRGLDYAVSADFTPAARDFYASDEGLVVIPYEVLDGDHSGFDACLGELHDRTSPVSTLRRLLHGRSILWFDPQPANNDYGHRKLEALSGVSLELATSVEQALDALRGRSEPFDLVISHFGHSRGGSNAEKLLEAMRKEDLRAPVIVFASEAYRRENRPMVLRLGAFAYEHEWGALFDRIEDLFDNGPRNEA